MAGRLRNVDLDFTIRLLKAICGTSVAAVGSGIVGAFIEVGRSDGIHKMQIGGTNGVVPLF